ncbi:PIN domain-containing protein [uncultured Thiodictyon sp.]|uniref:PIN domain-containing protein n=1 Tax=uncultured Thiodictyon sp. TaxID=1846217 RepID=UPI0025CFBADF|nr:PIN domain-containing protein [uncultured Thiodictyon sp.]
MKFLLDTNVISEFAKDQINAGLMEWLAHGDERAMAISVVSIGEMDTLIAAVAISHDLTLVTRNTDDFKRTGVRLINPWR